MFYIIVKNNIKTCILKTQKATTFPKQFPVQNMPKETKTTQL